MTVVRDPLLWTCAVERLPLLCRAHCSRAGSSPFRAFRSTRRISYPSKDIHLVVTTAAGGADDFVARTVAQRLSTTMGQPIIIENKPAGNGSVAAGEVARARADGYTLMMVVDSTLTINPHLYKTIDYDVFRDFTPISIITRLPTVLLARADLPANNLQELIALAQAHPGKLTYASTGVGTVLHVGMEMFKIATKTNIVHVPYRSTPGALNDLMAGRIDLMLAGITSALNHNDKIKALAITSAQRSPLLPNLPTVAESGVPGFSVTSWFALLGPLSCRSQSWAVSAPNSTPPPAIHSFDPSSRRRGCRWL